MMITKEQHRPLKPGEIVWEGNVIRGGYLPPTRTPEELDVAYPGPAATAYNNVTMRTSILDEANKIVNGARNKAYGSAEDNFQNIADLWNGYLKTTMTPVDVANMMVLMKIARLKHSPDHRDSWVDIAGYAACGAECGIK